MKICTACFTSLGEKKIYCKNIFGLSQNNSVAFCLLWQEKKKKHLMIRASSVLSGKLCYPLTLHLNEGLLFGFAFFCVEKGPTDRHTLAHIAYTQSCTLIQEMQKVTEQFEKKIISRLNLLF